MASDPGADPLVAELGEVLTRGKIGDGGGWMELDHHLDDAEPEHVPQMPRQGHVAIPGEERSQRAADRQSVEPCIGDRDRLHHGRRIAPMAKDGAEQRALERQHEIPSPLVPSGKRISASLAASRSAMASRCCAVLRTWRSTKTQRCSLANQPKSGHCAISLLEMNEPGMSEPSTAMSR